MINYHDDSDLLDHDYLSRLSAKLGAIAKVIDGIARNDSSTFCHCRCNDHGNVLCGNVAEIVPHCCQDIVGGRDGN